MQFYRHESDLLVFGADGKLCKLKSRSGQQQGDTLGSFLFCLGIHPILKAAHATWPNLLIRAICDDVHIVGDDAEANAAFTFVRDALADMGLALKYGSRKTCCWSPSFPQGLTAADGAARNVCSSLPAALPRLAGGMPVLGSFVGSDEFVTRAALEQVEDAEGLDPRSVRMAAAACSSAAMSTVRNARDLSGVLLRKCVIAKLGYLSRTLRPDLAAPALKRADDLCATAFCTIYSVDRAIFNTGASAEQRFAAARVRLPTSMLGCGIRSAVATSDAAYVACWRSVAPAIAKASSAGAKAALVGLGDGQPDAPCLQALAAAALRVAALLPADDRSLVALDEFCSKPTAGLQRKITHASESATSDSATTALRPSDTMSAFLRSCNGRWVRAARLKHMQLSNEEVVVRMQRYLRQPLSALAGLIGKLSQDVSSAKIVDPHGDCFLSSYAAKGDSEWRHLHDALCRAISGFASRAHVSNKLEGGKVRGTRKKPGDIRFHGDAGSHGWMRAGNRELWVDLTVVCPLLITYISAACHTTGAAAAAAATRKRNKYINDIPGFAFFMPLPFETEGYTCDNIELMLLGFAQRLALEALGDDATDQQRNDTARRWLGYWLDQLAAVHARLTARAIYNRASACKDALSAPFRRDSLVDIDCAGSLRTLPQPETAAAAAVRAAAAAAFAP
jgi:hypothetical protein